LILVRSDREVLSVSRSAQVVGETEPEVVGLVAGFDAVSLGVLLLLQPAATRPKTAIMATTVAADRADAGWRSLNEFDLLG
jgi:hypothetical protein